MRTPVVVTALLALLAGCNRGGDKPPAPGSNTVAATVLELSGEVTAKRDADTSPRRLAVDDDLFADDTVTTAADASVKIGLKHNGVRLALAGGKSVRLCDSVAWKAPRGSDPGLLAGETSDRTSVAGRHAERSAADDRSTARYVPETVSRRPRRPTSKGGDDTTKAPGGAAATERAADHELAGPHIDEVTITPDGATLSEDANFRLRSALDDKLAGCYRAVLGAIPGAEGDLTLTLSIDAAGKRSIDVKSFSPILDDCARAAVAKLDLGVIEDASGQPVAATVVVKISFLPE